MDAVETYIKTMTKIIQLLWRYM